MTQIRTLCAAEYPLMEEAIGGEQPDPQTSVVVAAMEDGEIVGRLVLCFPPHLEGAWIREDKRGGTIAARMVELCERQVQSWGSNKLLAIAVDDEKADYLERLGYKPTKWTLLVKELKDA